jgi:regulator of nucleoside diphosphate kinase
MVVEKSNMLIISERDYQRLLPLVEKYETSAASMLDDELGRAEIVRDAEFPDDVVAMNSSVTFIDLDTDEALTISLVYPANSDVEQMKISILSPVGSALIGLRVGGRIDWPLPNGKIRHLQVTAVIQPEKIIKQN